MANSENVGFDVLNITYGGIDVETDPDASPPMRLVQLERLHIEELRTVQCQVLAEDILAMTGSRPHTGGGVMLTRRLSLFL